MGLQTLPEEEPLIDDGRLVSCLQEEQAKLSARGDGADGLDLFKIWTLLDMTVNRALQLTRDLHHERQCRKTLESTVAKTSQDVPRNCVFNVILSYFCIAFY